MSFDVIVLLNAIFSRHGIPEQCVMNNGPQFSSFQFLKFAKAYRFQHITSSLYNARSNGEAKRAA